MPRETRSTRRRQGRSTRRRGRSRIHTFFQFQRNEAVILILFFDGRINNKVYRRGAAFQRGLNYVNNENMSVADFRAAVKEQEAFRSKGAPGGAVYRTTDKTPEEFAAIAKRYGGKESAKWFEGQLEFVRDQTAKLIA
jgi:hypothetical protein